MPLLSADSGTELRVVLLNPHHGSVTWACRGAILQMRKIMKAWRGHLPGSDNESEVEPESQPRPSCLRGDTLPGAAEPPSQKDADAAQASGIWRAVHAAPRPHPAGWRSPASQHPS